MTPRAGWVCALLLGAALAFVYGGHVARAGFVYQDAHWNDPLGPGMPAPTGIAHSRPLMQWTWWAQAQITSSARAFHLVNLALHLIAVGLVWLLARRLGASAGAAWVAAAVLLLDVASVETAAYAAERTELFAAIGVLLAAVLIAGEWSIWTPAIVGAAWLFGLAGKESAIALIAIGPMVAIYTRARLDGLIVAGGFVALFLFVYGAAYVLGMTAPHPGSWAMLQAASAWRVAIVAVTGIGASVEFDYSAVPMIARTAAAVLSVASLEIAWRVRHRWPLATIGGLWAAAVVLPRLIVWTPDIMMIHQGYLALAGLALVAAALVDGPEDEPCL